MGGSSGSGNGLISYEALHDHLVNSKPMLPKILHTLLDVNIASSKESNGSKNCPYKIYLLQLLWLFC